MAQVFSRWPSAAPPSAREDRAGSGSLGSSSSGSGPLRSGALQPGAPDLPAWMLAPARPRWPGLTRDLAIAGALVLVPALLAALVPWGTLEAGPGLVAAAGGLAAAAALACLQVVRLLRALRLSEERFGAIFERAGVSMWREDWTAAGAAVAALRRAGVQDIEGHFAEHPEELRAICGKVIIRDVNAFTVEETGAPDKSAYLGPLDRLLPPTDQTFVQWLVAFGRGDRYFRSEAHVTRADGEESDMLFTAMLPRDTAGFADILVTSLDITAYKKTQTRLAAAETELARASRVTTVGALSASIAHEVNTPLAAIAANAQAALRWLKRTDPDIPEAVAALDGVVSEAVRARDVVARTRAFLGQAPMDLTRIDLVRAARDATLFAERELRANGATVLLTGDADIPLVTGDLVQIQQVFVNLLVNAAQAMGRQTGRRDVAVAIHRAADMVQVTVSDAGPGIAPEQRTRIFEPFHSTKPGGMGMGLAICRTCIDAHGGKIWVDAAASGGAAFHFTLPVSAPASRPHP